MTTQIMVGLIAGRSARDIAASVGCDPGYVGTVKRRKGLKQSRPIRYFTFDRKEQVRKLWLEDDFCATAISVEIGFPVELVIGFLQKEGLV